MRRINFIVRAIIYICLALFSFFFLSACEGNEVEKNRPEEIGEKFTEPGVIMIV